MSNEHADRWRGRRTKAAVVAAALVVAAVPATLASAQSAPPAVDPTVAAQIEAIQLEKAARTPTEQKLDSNLLYAVRETVRGEVAVNGAPALRSSVELEGTDVVVDIDATVDAALLDAIVSAGGEVLASVPGFDAVRARVPVASLMTLASRAQVTGVRPADEATTNRADAPAGDVGTASEGAGVNEAEVTHGADLARQGYGVDGTGVKVCVLSDGVDTLAARQASGDLPAVDVLPGQAGSGREGTAMLELVHDIAPGAELGFASAFGSMAQFAQNIIDLRADGCDVLVDDITYFGETTLQDDVVAKAITTVRDDGAVFFTSATNSGNLPDGTSGTWQGDFQDSNPSQSPLSLGLRVHGWGQGAMNNQLTTVGGPLNLQWADPEGASTNDYDLYVLNEARNQVVASSTNVQNGSQDPVEGISSAGLIAGDRVMVTKPVAAESRYLVLYSNRGRLTYGTGGSARGHNGSLDAVSVAATPAAQGFGGTGPTGPYPAKHSSANVTETFSSDGPIRQYFTPAGAAITPGNFTSTGGVGRNGVDITAADGVATTTPDFLRFYGTSASAPNAAAMAALALEAKPALTPLQVENALASTAIDIEAAGYDPVTGAGVIMAEPFLANVGAVAKARLTAGNLFVTPQTGDGDSLLEPGETASVTQQLTNAGGATATAISATLTSNGPDATVTQGSVTYPNIAAGASAAPNSLAAKISVSPGCTCTTPLPFTLTVTYTGGRQPSVAIPVSVAVSPQSNPNRPPVAANDSYTLGQGTTFTLAAPGVLGNDSDPDSDPITAVVVNQPSNGTLALAANGSLTYTPTPSFRGSDSFTYRASDGLVTSTLATVSLTVNGTPVPLPDSYTTAVDTTLNVPAPGVLTNDGDPEGNSSTVAIASQPSHGSVSLNGNGSFAYTPAGGYVGPDSFTYRASDAYSQSSPATVSITVSADANLPPVAVADSYDVVSNGSTTISAPGVLGNDSDPDGGQLSAVKASNPSHGSVSLSSNGAFTYTPTAGYAGTDSFTYRASDGLLQSVATTVTFEVVSPIGAYVDAAYRDFLDRAGDAGGRAYWGGRLERGAETRASFILKMARSHEYAVKIVTRSFYDVLDRDTDPAGREYWANRVERGMPPSTLVLNLIASDEFLANAGDSVGEFVDASYQAILGRLADPSGKAFKISQIERGRSRLAVALEVYRSAESRERRTRAQFSYLLGRNPTLAEITFWVGQLAVKTDTDLAVALASSQEYFDAAAAR